LQPIERVNDFETGWDELLSKSLDNHPFLTYEWLTSWRKHFGKGKELELFTARSEGAISLAIPVMYSTRRVFGMKLSTVEFAAAPESDCNVFLVTSIQEASRAVDELIESMMEESNDADCVVFEDVPENSLTSRPLEKGNDEGLGGSRLVTDSCPYIPLPHNFEMFLSLWARICAETQKCGKGKH
jgi:hypothetical protein